MKQTTKNISLSGMFGPHLKGKPSVISYTLLALALACGTLPAQAEFSTLSETVLVTVEDTTASGALYQAQRQALTRVVEAYLRSKTPPPVRNIQIIMDELWPNAKAFFESQQFLEQKSNFQTAAQVKIQFKIKTRELTQAVDKILVNLQTKKSAYRLSVLVFETQDGNDTEVSSLRLELENTLLKQGFTIIDPEYTEKMLSEKRTRFSEILKNDQKAAELAREQGADLAIVVHNQIKLERLSQYQQQATSHVVLRAIMASMGHKHFNIEEYIVGQGPNNERAQTESGKNAGRELGSRLVDELTLLAASQLKPTATKTTKKSLRLVVGGLNTYRKQALPLLKLLQGISLITGIELHSQGGEQTVFLLTYEGQQSELENKIWEKLEGQEALTRLDRNAAVENTVYLFFKPPFNVILTGITDYRKQALPFIKMLKEIARVKEVDTRSFGSTQLVLDVFYDGPPGDLEAGIWNQLDVYRDYPPLYREASSNPQIKFNLLQGTLN